jgi:hypothetical protein
MPSRLSEHEQAIVLDIVSELRPEERFLAADYFVTSNRRWAFRGSPVDFGLETELNVITPWVTMVVVWACGVIKGEVRAILEERLRNIVRRMFKIKDPVLPPESPRLSAPQAGMAARPDLSAQRTELTNYGMALGLAPQMAAMLAELAVTKALEAVA